MSRIAATSPLAGIVLVDRGSGADFLFLKGSPGPAK
jgi:hypothetical protein